MKHLRDGFLCHVGAIKSGIGLGVFTSNQLINLYSRNSLLVEAKQLFDEMPERNVFSWNAIISSYVKAQNLTQARALFDSASHKDLVSYNTMLSGYAGVDGYETQALELFNEMQSARDRVGVDEFTLTTMLNLIAKLYVIDYGRQIHSYMIKVANNFSEFAVSSLIDMYSKCQSLQDAYNVFNSSIGREVDVVSKNAMVAAFCRAGQLDMALDLFWKYPELNDTVSWNTIIAGCAQNGFEEKGLALFIQMAESEVNRNEHTLATVLNACSGLKNLKLGKSIHTWVLKNGLILNQFISSGIIDLYCKCEIMQYAESVLSQMDTENSFAIGSMIMGYSSQGKMVETQNLFDSLQEKNTVLWTALFSGYLKSQQCEAVFKLLRDFLSKESMVLDELIIINVLGACAMQASLNSGKQVHTYTLRMGVKMDEKLQSALVDMYSKCGSITYAEKVFQTVSNRDSISYDVMIIGYARHGFANKTFQLYQEMLERGFKPGAATFVALLSACRHCGAVELGEQYFNSMKKDHAISPEVDHYASLIDMYGRANQLEKAAELINNMPVEMDSTILGAFLNACRISGNAALAKEAEERLHRTGTKNVSRFVQLANVYAAEGNWDEVRRIRKKMRGKEFKKVAGCSWVYVEDMIHVFTSGDSSHTQATALYSMLDCLSEELYAMSRKPKNTNEPCEAICSMS